MTQELPMEMSGTVAEPRQGRPRPSVPFISPRRGEVWWVRGSDVGGGLIRGTRPGVIVSDDAANRHLNRVVIVPTTTNIRHVFASETLLDVQGTACKACVDQIRTVTKTDLIRLAGSLNRAEQEALDRALRLHLGLF